MGNRHRFQGVSGNSRGRGYFVPLTPALSGLGYDEYDSLFDPNNNTYSLPGGGYVSDSGRYYPPTAPFSPGTSAVTENQTALDYVRAFGDIVRTGLNVKLANDLNEINLQRVRQGLPPLTQQQMAAMSPQLNVGVAPDQADLIKYFGIGALILGAIYILKKR